jgi:hypothetical protein
MPGQPLVKFAHILKKITVAKWSKARIPNCRSALCKRSTARRHFSSNEYGRKKIARNIYPDDLTVDSFRRRAESARLA